MKEAKIKVGITGQNGFIGSHLRNYLQLDDKLELVGFDRNFFESNKSLDAFVRHCDVIVHLAGMNRHESQEVIYQTNVNLADKLIEACERTASTPKIIFSSSTQENADNAYGKSKLKARQRLTAWAQRNHAQICGLIIPNVFGPFGKPYYNSFIATFCHQIAHSETPTVLNDSQVKLIYVNELICLIKEKVYSSTFEEAFDVEHSAKFLVTEILELLNGYKENYMDQGIIPSIIRPFERDLFNTFRCYIPNDHFPISYTQHRDARGAFVEIARTNTHGQFSYSTTVPGITRGNHFHTRKAERFAVISGKASIKIRRVGTADVVEYILDGDEPAYVDMPIWSTHNITNIGDKELVTLFWISEPYDPTDPDTFFEDV